MIQISSLPLSSLKSQDLNSQSFSNSLSTLHCYLFLTPLQVKLWKFLPPIHRQKFGLNLYYDEQRSTFIRSWVFFPCNFRILE